MRAAEREKLEKLGRPNYAKEFMRSVKRALHGSVEMYAQWLFDTTHPSVCCGGGSDVAGGYWFTPPPRNRLLLFKACNWDALAGLVFTQWPPFLKSEQEIVSPPDGQLPEMPVVQSAPQDLRDGGGVVLEPADTQT